MRSCMILLVLAATLLLPTVSDGGTTIIDFDGDASGQPLTAPTNFGLTVALTDLYAPLGVHFSGPGALNGGAILDTGSNFGVPAASLPNFLAFNRGVSYPSGGQATDPEEILFDDLMESVSIEAAGGNGTGSFLLRAFDDSDVVVDEMTLATSSFGLLTVSSSAGIRRVELIEQGNDNAFIYDNLTFTTLAVVVDAFTRGDCNDDGGFNLPDAVVLLNYLFPQSGPPAALPCSDACDGNDDGGLNLTDAIAILNALFGMPSIPLQEPSSCGPDPTAADGLDCAIHSSCP